MLVTYSLMWISKLCVCVRGVGGGGVECCDVCVFLSFSLSLLYFIFVYVCAILFGTFECLAFVFWYGVVCSAGIVSEWHCHRFVCWYDMVFGFVTCVLWFVRICLCGFCIRFYWMCVSVLRVRLQSLLTGNFKDCPRKGEKNGRVYRNLLIHVIVLLCQVDPGDLQRRLWLIEQFIH